MLRDISTISRKVLRHASVAARGGLSAALLLLSSLAAAQEAAPEQPPAETKFDIRLVGGQERKPVTYEFVHGQPTFKVMINGREGWALLDNDLPVSVIDAGFARSLGLQLTPVGDFVSPSGSLERWRVEPWIEIEIPGQARTVEPVSAIDLSRVSALFDRPISMVFGREYFEVLLFMFTPGNRQLRLGPSGSLRLPPDTRELVLRGDRPDLEVMIGGRPAVLTIDLGTEGEISLSQAAWDRVGMTELPITSNMTTSVAGTVSYSVATEVDEVSLGTTRVSDVKVALKEAVLEGRDGFVGFGLLSQFNFAIDVKARRVWLIPPFSEENEAESGD